MLMDLALSSLREKEREREGKRGGEMEERRAR